MQKACSRCGKVHPYNYRCSHGRKSRPKGKDPHNNHKWHKLAEEVKHDANDLCEECFDKGRYTYTGLEVHHIVPIKEDIEQMFDKSNLVCLCVDCHRLSENGYIDREHLSELAERRNKKQMFDVPKKGQAGVPKNVPPLP